MRPRPAVSAFALSGSVVVVATGVVVTALDAELDVLASVVRVAVVVVVAVVLVALVAGPGVVDAGCTACVATGAPDEQAATSAIAPSPASSARTRSPASGRDRARIGTSRPYRATRNDCGRAGAVPLPCDPVPIATILAIAGVLAVAAYAQGISGFGFSLLSVPVVSALTTTSRAVIIVALTSEVASLRVAATNHEHIDWSAVRRVGIGTLVGLPFGLFVLEHAGNRPLKLIVGVVVLALAIALAVGVKIARPSTRADLVSGFACGVLTTSTGTNGPPVVIGLHSRQLEPSAFRATATTIFVLTGAIGVVLFVARGLIDHSSVAAAAIGVPGIVIAGWFAERTARTLDRARFARIVLVLLFVSATSAIIGALVG